MITAEELDNQFPRNRVTYKGRTIPGKDGFYPMDVRHFVFYPDAQLEQICLGVRQEPDKAVQWVEGWVRGRVQYAPDQALEFWQLPAETLFLGKGDCEDMAILCASMMLCAGVPAHRVKVCACKISHNGVDIPHCCVLYYRDSESWVAIDPTRPSLDPVGERPKFKDDGFYKDIIFTFNNYSSWGQENHELE